MSDFLPTGFILPLPVNHHACLFHFSLTDALARLEAMFTLARCFRDGIGTESNRQEAKRWLDQLMVLAHKEKSNYRYAAGINEEIDA